MGFLDNRIDPQAFRHAFQLWLKDGSKTNRRLLQAFLRDLPNAPKLAQAPRALLQVETAIDLGELALARDHLENLRQLAPEPHYLFASIGRLSRSSIVTV